MFAKYESFSVACWPVLAALTFSAVVQAAAEQGTGVASGLTAIPVFSPLPRPFVGSQWVALADSTPGAAIYYTTDGSTPTTASTLFGAPFEISSTTTISAIAVAAGDAPSAVVSGTYTLERVTAAPVLSPIPRSFTGVQWIGIGDATGGAAIYYTTDGSKPTANSTPYTKPFKITATTTVNALAIGPSGDSASAVTSGTYTLSTIPAVPTGLTPTAANGSVALSWNPSTGATSYTVLRAASSSGPFAAIGTSVVAAYTDTGLNDGTVYYYEVSAADSNGASANSAPVSAIPTAGAAGNLRGPLGVNVSTLNYYTNEMPFLNSMKTAGPYNNTANQGWMTENANGGETNEEAYLQVDANGYPTTLVASSQDPNQPQLFTQVSVLVMRKYPYVANAPSGTNGYYPGGYYAVLYDGQGKLSYGADATFVSTSATASGGRDLITVNPSAGGIYVRITSTDPDGTGNYLRNIRLVQTGSDGTATPGSNEAALANGQIFTPQFLSLMSPFSLIRFMQWFNLDSPNNLSSWASRPQVGNASYTSPNGGVPYEVAIALANAVGENAWLNVPIEATDDFITQFGNLTAKTLNSPQKLYVELSNEVWDSGFPSYSWAVNAGKVQFPNVPTDMQYPFYYAMNWYGMRASQTCSLVKAAWTANGANPSRVVCVLSGQASYTAVALEAASCPFWVAQGNTACGNHVDVIAIGPYFGGFVPNAWAEAPLVNGQGSGLDSLFESLTTQNDPTIPVGGWLGHSSMHVTETVQQLATTAAAAGFPDLPVIAYEAGQTFIPFDPANGVYEAPLLTDYTNLFTTANLDPRMGTAYTSFFDSWKQDGGTLMVIFDDVGVYGPYGEFGAIQSVMQPLSPLSATPPKWQAIQSFISSNPCWWGTTANPCAPASKRPPQ